MDISNYKTYLAQETNSKNTINNYYSVAEKFLSQYLFTTDSIQQLIESLKIQGRSAATINNKLSALRKLNNYLIETKQTNILIVKSKDFIDIQPKEISPNIFTNEQIEKILNKIKKDDTKRNYTMIYLVVATGIRRDEITKLLMSNIDLNKGKMRVIGKGNKERTVYLNDDIIEVLKDYIKDKKDSPYLFPSKKSTTISNSRIDAIFSKHDIQPHQMRHFCASRNVREGVSIDLVGGQLGHKDLNTTKIYVNLTEQEIKDKINKASMKNIK